MDDSEIDLRGIFNLLRRQFRLIVLAIASCLAIGTILVLALTPIYSATALIMVDPASTNLLDPEATATGAADSARIDSEVEILASDSVMLKTIAAENLLADAGFGSATGWREAAASMLGFAPATAPDEQTRLDRALGQMQGAINAERRGQTYLIALNASSPDPELAARLANGVAAAYIEDQLQAKIHGVMGARDILQARVIQARAGIGETDGAFDDFIAQTIAGDAGAFGALQQRIAAEDRVQADANARIDSVASGLGQSFTPQVEPGADLASLREAVVDSEVRQASLRQQLREQALASPLSGESLVQLYDLQQNAELAREQYQTLLLRVRDLDTQADLQLADSRIVSAALTPARPSFPNPPLMLLLAALAGTGIGIGLALVADKLVGGFTSEEQAEAVLKTRIASAIPRTKITGELHSLADLVVTAPLSIFSESVRRVRAAIDQHHGPERPDGQARGRVVMMTSTAPNEGKTTIGLALARSYALSGRRTLIIDCDLRQPSIHRQLDLEPSHGLQEFLNGVGTDLVGIGSIARADTMSHAMVVVGAHRSETSTDQLFSSPSFATLVDAARHTFDIVILDTPPVGPVIDGLYLAAFADVIVFATKWVSTSQSDARKALGNLTAAKRPDATILAVLNQQDASRHHYQRKYGGYYQPA